MISIAVLLRHTFLVKGIADVIGFEKTTGFFSFANKAMVKIEKVCQGCQRSTKINKKIANKQVYHELEDG